MELIRWEPFFDMESRLNRFFGNSAAATAGHWAPAMDILESADAYIVRAELPGFKKEDMTVEVNNGILTLAGERKREEPASGAEYRSIERAAGKFSRSVVLPERVNHEAIAASYKDGVLEVMVPKAEEAKPRQITVH